MATLDDILSPVWTLSVDGGGSIAEGITAIEQCLSLIIRTTPGSDPLRPTFGCGLYSFVDQPVNQAIPNMKKAILDAVARWETRVTITKITDSLGDIGQIIFNIGYELADGTISDSLTVSVGSGGVSTGVVSQRIIIQASIPVNAANLQYQVSAVINGAAILPAPPSAGFASIGDLYTWVQNNWTNFGQWYLTAGALIGYLNSTYTSGSLTMAVLSIRSVTTQIPQLSTYTVTVSVNGTLYSNTDEINTPGAILQYLNNDQVLGALGKWQIQSIPADYSLDFSDDFGTYIQVLQLTTESTDNIEITIAGS